MKSVTELRDKLGEDFATCWFQQDSAPPHTARETIALLHRLFEGRLIAKNAALEWPPNSPDLNPLDYWFWGLVSSRVGPRGDMSRCELIATACLAIRAIGSDLNGIADAVMSFRTRLAACIEAHGHHFEHYYRAMKDRLAAFANRPCESCKQVHDNCEACTQACFRLWFANFDFSIGDLVEEANLDNELELPEVAGDDDEE